MRLLIVEDEPFIAADLAGIAEGMGYTVAGIADSKDSAIDLARTLPVDAAIVDMKLRDGFTGPDIAQSFRRDFNIPFGFVTGNAELAPSGAGAVAVVPKPFEEASVMGLLRALAALAAAGAV